MAIGATAMSGAGNDRHPDWGKKKLVWSIDEALEEIKKVYPDAYLEGSAGLQRSFFVTVENRDPNFTGNRMKKLLVGHCWSSGRVNKDFNYRWYVRVAPEPKEW